MAEIIILDVETTGLKRDALILECAWAHIHPETLEVLHADATLVLHVPVEPYLEPTVREMHTESGLLGALKDALSENTHTQTVWGHADLDAWLTRGIRDLDVQPAGVYLCGMSVQFDRRMLDTYCPGVRPYLSHRQLDLSTIRELGRFWEPLGAPQLPKVDMKHRAAADVAQALETLRFYQKEIWKILPSHA